ncbi:MAG: hypothetical protein U1B30_16185 [Pseudomonadota bacterium]|nr:hypothetical protein [Pseudomonadota bacterium]
MPSLALPIGFFGHYHTQNWRAICLPDERCVAGDPILTLLTGVSIPCCRWQHDSNNKMYRRL